MFLVQQQAYLDLKQDAGILDADGLGASALAMTHINLAGTSSQTVALVGSTAGVGIGSSDIHISLPIHHVVVILVA